MNGKIVLWHANRKSSFNEKTFLSAALPPVLQLMMKGTSISKVNEIMSFNPNRFFVITS